MQHHKYALSELEEMIPWEREIYISLLVNYIKEENEKRRREREQIMFEETTSKTVKSIKWVWWFLKEELPQFLSNWRTVPRIMMVLIYSIL